MSTDIKAKTTMTIGLYVDMMLDPDNYDWHIDLRPGHLGPEVATVIAVAEALGMEIYDEEECEPTVLEDGTMRLWMSPKDPVDV